MEEQGMFERTCEIEKYQWTARGFELFDNKIDFRNVVLEFVCPIVQVVRHGKDKLAERWYWSWWKKPQTNLFIRLYFLGRTESHAKIWQQAEEVRKGEFETTIGCGASEDAWTDLSDAVLEWGITLEHASEMSLMIWKGKCPGSNDRYGKTFHHFFEPLLVSDGKALEILQASLGKGILR